MFDYEEAEANYWYNKFRSLEAKTPKVAMFDISDQSFTFYTKDEWKEAIAQMVFELEREEIDTWDMGDYEIVEAWGGDELFVEFLP